MAISPDDQRRIDAAAARAGVDAATLAAVVAEGATLTAAQRDRVRREKGLDAKESRDNEIDAVAIELARAQKAVPTPELAVAAFKADSADPASWDRPTRAFARRVSRRTGAGIQMQAPAPAAQIDTPVEATPAPMDVAPPAGEAEPQGRQFGRAPEPEPVADEADPQWVDAYRSGQMSPQDRAEFEADVKAGRLRLPEGVQLAQAPAAPAPSGGILDSLADVVTGDSRKTAQTEASLDVNLSPQMQRLRMQSIAPGSDRLSRTYDPNMPLGERVKQQVVDTALGTAQSVGNMLLGGVPGMIGRLGLESAPQREQMQMVAAANPQLQVVRDERGNQSFIDPATGARYGETPGLGLTDIPRIAATVGPGLVPGAGGLTGARAIGAAMGLQGAQEAAQGLMGGEVNVEDVALAGVGEALPMLRAAKPAAEAAAEGAEAVAKGVPLVESKVLGADIRAAAGGNAEAMARVASLAAVDKEAAKAAADLGLDLPLNVLADGPQIREAADAVISKMAGPERAAFKESEVALAKKADEVLASFDAAFVDGRVAPGEVSAKVAASMKAARDQAEASAKAAYRQVDEVVPNESIVQMNAVRMQIMKRAEQVGSEGLSAPERAILEKIKEGDVPLGLIRQEKSLIGEAVGRLNASSPYASMEKGAMKALYAALAADEAAAVARIGGDNAAKMLKKAHNFTKVQKGIEERIIKAFGKADDGDITPLMRRALTNAVSDDNKALKELIKVVPKENRREVLATAIAGLGRDTGGRFNAAKFADAYPGLWKNKVARDLIRENLGPEADKMLGALASVSKRVAYANKRTPKTGESLQELARMDAAPGIIGRVVQSGIGKAAITGAAGAASGGLAAGAVAGLLGMVPNKAKGATLEAMSALLRDDSFAKLAIDMANGTVPPADVKRMARNPRFRAFLRAIKEPYDPTAAEKWLTQSFRGATMGGDREPVEKRPTL